MNVNSYIILAEPMEGGCYNITNLDVNSEALSVSSDDMQDFIRDLKRITESMQMSEDLDGTSHIKKI